MKQEEMLTQLMKLDTANIGLEPGDTEGGYFCTPVGMKVIGWECEGIHYGTIDSYGDMIFTVNPMSCTDRNVYPLAENLTDFLRLILAGKGTTAIEQIVWMSREQYEEFVEGPDNTSPEAEQVLKQIQETFGLTPMEDAYTYVKALQEKFDDSRLAFSQEYYDALGLEPPREKRQHKGTHITTYTGINFYPLDPDPEDFEISDIAHALSLECRGNGHVKQFFSVGQHCIHCALEAKARGYSDRLCAACLIHDASEAYMSDVPRPFKEYLTDYIAIEDRMLSMIYTRFLGADLTEQEAALVKSIDNDLLAYDLCYLLNEGKEEDLPKLSHSFVHEVEPFAQVEETYLKLFYQFQEKELAGKYHLDPPDKKD